MATNEQLRAARLAQVQNRVRPSSSTKSATQVATKTVKRAVLLWALGLFLAALPWILLLGVVLLIIIVVISALPDVIVDSAI